MTNAQIHADNAVRAKNQVQEPRAQFKLKRFQDVNPRTSTKRGDNAYMVQSGARKVVSSQNVASANDDGAAAQQQE